MDNIQKINKPEYWEYLRHTVGNGVCNGGCWGYFKNIYYPIFDTFIKNHSFNKTYCYHCMIKVEYWD